MFSWFLTTAAWFVLFGVFVRLALGFIDEFCEHHLASIGLKIAHKFDINGKILARETFGVVDNNHRAVGQIGHSLMRIAASADDFDVELVDGEIFTAKPLRKVVYIDGVNFFGSGDFSEIKIVRKNNTLVFFGKL